MWIVATQAAATASGQSIILLNKDGDLAIMAGMPPEDNLGPADWTAARWSLKHGEVAGWNSETLPNARFQYHPLKTPHGIAGVVGIRPNEAKLSAEAQRMMEALMDQVSIALERTILADEAADARASAEGERLRSALLSSISHDLRTPLSSIVGSVTTLRSLDSKMTKPVRDDLLANIEEEASRLSRFVANLLDMTKIEGGAVKLGKEHIDVADVVAAAARRARQTWPEREIVTKIGSGIPAALGDAALLEQLVFNLLDNAHKYSPAGTPTSVSVEAEKGDIILNVDDDGPGIPSEELERVFEKFYRIKEGDGRSPGTGLGLAICRGIANPRGRRVCRGAGRARVARSFDTSRRTARRLRRSPRACADAAPR